MKNERFNQRNLIMSDIRNKRYKWNEFYYSWQFSKMKNHMTHRILNQIYEQDQRYKPR